MPKKTPSKHLPVLKSKFVFAGLFVATILILLIWTYKSDENRSTTYPYAGYGSEELSLTVLQADTNFIVLALDRINFISDNEFCLSKITITEQQIKPVQSYNVFSNNGLPTVEDAGEAFIFEFYEHDIKFSDDNICSDSDGYLNYSFTPDLFQVKLSLTEDISPIYYPFDINNLSFLVTIEIMENEKPISFDKYAEIFDLTNKAENWDINIEKHKFITGQEERNLFFLSTFRPAVSKIFTIVSTITLLIFIIPLFFIRETQSLLEALIALTLGIIGIKDLIQMPNHQAITFLDVFFISIYLLAAFLLLARIRENNAEKANKS